MTNNEENLLKAVQTVLTPDLVPEKYRGRPENPMFGQCYGAAEALYRLLGAKEHGYKAQRATDNEGIVHWWVLSPIGNVLDPTAAQYTDFGKIPPHAKGLGASFRRPSKRAEIIMKRVSNLMLTG